MLKVDLSKVDLKRVTSIQKPHTIFIACSDSRVMPGVITNSKEGEIFVIRNVANIVDSLCVKAAVEYGVRALGIKNIVVCGHSDCGGLKALKGSKLKYVDKWLESIKDLDGDIGYANVLRQVENLRNFEFIDENINIYGWYYVMHEAKIYNYNFSTSKWELI